MRIKKVELKNIGPHCDFSVELSQGLIGIVGSNGAGKSTLVNSIYAALTNDFTRFSNVKSDIITNGSTGHSYIRLAGVHRGQEFQLTRWLRPNKNEFRIGNREYTKATDVNDAVTAELNITKAVIDKYVFVDQWQMFGFLDETSSERAKAFQFLCGTEIASQIHKVCSEYVAKQKGTEVVDNSLELEQAIAEAAKRMADNKQQGQSVEPYILSEADVEQLQLILQAARRAEEARPIVEATEKQLGLIQQRLSQVNKAKVNATRHRDKFEKWLKVNQEKLRNAKNSLKVAEAYDQAIEERRSAKAELVKAQEELLKLEAKIPDYAKYIAKADREESQKRLGHLRALVEAVEDAQVTGAVCKYCKQEISATHRGKIIQELKSRRFDLDQLQASMTYSVKFDEQEEQRQRKYQDWEKHIAKQQSRIQLAEQFLESHKSHVAVEKARKLITKGSDVESDLATVKQQLEAFCLTWDKLAERKQTLEVRCAARYEAIQAEPDAEEVERARKALSTSQAAVRQRAQALGAYREAKQSKQRAETMLAQLKLRMAERAKVQSLLDMIGQVGDIFHWNQLPKAVSQANLELLVGDINANLAMFNHPFTVEAEEDLTFRVFMPGQLPVKAKQLSGGQKVLLAIAFRAALDRVFGHDVGMMFLDEPTSGLDADNINYFHEALQQLAQKVGEDRQLVVITHVQELGAVFDQLVEVKKG